MRDRWREMDEKFGSQAANAAEQARQQTKIINSEKQTLAPQKQIPDSSNTAERTATKAAAAVDFIIAQAKEQKDIEVSKRKWITRQSLLTDTLNYSPAELTIDRVKAEFSEREKSGELKEFELDRRKAKLQAERENQNAEKAISASLISERIINEGVIKLNEPTSLGNLENTRFNDERLTDQREETFRADTKTAIEDSPLQTAIQKPAVQDQVIEIDPAMTARREAPALESETVVKDSLFQQIPLFDRKDFASEEKSATEALSNPEPPNPVIPPEKIETNHREASEIKLEIKQQSEKSFENIYDKPGILQSRTRTSGSRRRENEIIADHTDGGEHSIRVFRDGRRLGSGDNTSESNIVSPIKSNSAISHTAFVGSARTGESEPKLTDYAAEHHRGNSDSATETRTGAEQNSMAGRRERELSDRSGSAGSGKSDDRRIIGGGIEKGENGGESDKLPFKPIESVENESVVQAKPDFQPKTVEMETTPRLEPSACVAQIEIAGATFTSFRDNRTDDQAARGGHEIAGNDRENLGAVERDDGENTSIDAKSERRVDRREKRNEESENKHRRVELGAAASQTIDDLGGISIEDGDKRTATLSNQIEEPQIANGGEFESEGFADTRTSDGSQRAAERRTSTSTERIGENERTDSFDSATKTVGEGIGGFDRTKIQQPDRVDRDHIEGINRAADFSDAVSGMLFRDEQGFKRESGSGDKEISGNGEAAKYSTKGQNDDRAEFQQYCSDVAANIPGNRAALQSVAVGAGEDNSISVEANRRTAEKTAQLINVKRFSGGLDSQIVAEWTTIIEKSDAADFLNEVIKLKSREEEQQLFGHLDAQAALIAKQVKLPQPEPEAKPNALKLAVALTEIEVANYEQASGKPLCDKVFEVLVKENMRRAAAPPQPEQIEGLQETFGDRVVESTVKPSSALEAEALNALLDSVRCGFDASAVIQAQRYVNTNDAAAQATATLVQIAYGGQTNAFTDNFKDNLAEQIYYAPVPASDAYRNFGQFDWLQTIENFAPTVNNLAEQYKIEIKPPDGDLERNKRLADFVARQLVEAYESQNRPLERYVQNQLTANILRAGNLEVSQPQKDTIAALTDQNLEPPKLSNALEANAYSISKYDEEQKATQAVRLTDRIREVAQIKAEKHAAMEMEIERVQVLTM